MKVSLSWLSKYVPIELGPNELADALTMVGLEVEAVSNRFEYLDKVVVGDVVQVGPHPNADKLKLCEVDVGDRLLRIVCGAPNVANGLRVPIAMPGMVFLDGFHLERAAIRGVESEGMICSERELGLSADHSGVMVLEPTLKPGQQLVSALGLSDFVLEIDVTPNRSDCLSIIGVAREIAAIQNTPLKYPDCHIQDGQENISDFTSVTIDAPEHCPRYTARLIDGVKIGLSPFWLQDRLFSVGLRPINNVVDITNFILMEMGQPLHAFDFDNLAENRIVVRTANPKERFETLDQTERVLEKDMLMICDGKRPVGIAGVMGGLNSEIGETTTRVLIESAYFNPKSIRKTAKKLGLNTEASHRFERGVDPEGTRLALDRASRLMVEICGGKAIGSAIDNYPQPISNKKIFLSVKDTNRLLGRTFFKNEVEERLSSIEFKVESVDEETLAVQAPPFRVDIQRPQDLMEEVARLTGFDHIPATFPVIPAGAKHLNQMVTFKKRIRRLMAGLGFLETINYSFVSGKSIDRLRLKDDDSKRQVVKILNPLAKDQSIMRTSLVPGLLETVCRNISQQIRSLKLFEVGKVYIGQGVDHLPEETEMLTVLWTGSRFDSGWFTKEAPCNFFDIKGTAEGLFQGLKIERVKFTALSENRCSYTELGQTAQIFIGDDEAGLVGEVNHQVLKNFDIHQNVFICELNVNHLLNVVPDSPQSEPISKYPAASRDFTIIVDKEIESREILHCVENIQEKLIEAVHLFDVFEGTPIQEGKKSISFRITYRSKTKTLEDENVNRIHQLISKTLLSTFDALLPE